MYAYLLLKIIPLPRCYHLYKIASIIGFAILILDRAHFKFFGETHTLATQQGPVHTFNVTKEEIGDSATVL